ncbi:LysR family transcriptional regulator [Saccharomonospora sp. NPDC046836]|uniref:LysR family transcriptional regulator n=1 Tax=Saccharomonospora sp. NPDC046836 TaxID=3156921 RepID=UPI0033F8E4CE
MLHIWDLQCLVVLADELSFSRAADRLNVSQSSLSQTVKRLERAVGGLLVERTTRRSRLTPAGKVLVDGAERMLDELARLEERTRDVIAGRSISLRIGAVNPAMRVLVPRILGAIQAEVPDVQLSLRPASSNSQLRLLVDGQLDVGLLRAQDVPAGFHCEPLIHEPLYCVLPRSHPLADKLRVEFSELDGEDFVMAPRVRNTPYFDELIRNFSLEGCSPGRIIEAHDMWAQLALIGAGRGVSVLPFLFVDHTREDIVFLPLERDLSLPLALAYPTGSSSAALTAALRAARAESVRLLDEERERRGDST